MIRWLEQQRRALVEFRSWWQRLRQGPAVTRIRATGRGSLEVDPQVLLQMPQVRALIKRMAQTEPGRPGVRDRSPE